ncbi:MAG TPA: hypothetical protein VFS43_29810, partial [Polyangiaceae bacterium]|nr:hypothetical protein [Polyangiaceae bacterium]
ALYEPPPPRVGKLRSVRTWRPGHAPPKVALEVVSKNHPTKDYRLAPAKYDASGTGELWVFDPLLAGPREGGGPHLLQLWARGPGGRLERAYAGAGPVRSPFFGAWLVVVDEEGPRLRLSDDPQGRQLWPTPQEAERAAKEAAERKAEAERAAKEAERAAKEAAERKAEAERAAKKAERAAKEAAERKAEAERAAKEAERQAKEEALAELARLREEVARLHEGKAR